MRKPLKIAWIGHGWNTAVCHRPHHWRTQALARGHEFHVFTLPLPLFRKKQNNPIPAKNVHTLPRSVIEAIMRRTNYGKEAYSRLHARFETYAQHTIDQCGGKFDVVMYGSFPLRNLKRIHDAGVFIYDCMDAWGGFTYIPSDVLAGEARTVEQADLVLAVSQPLFDRFTSVCDKNKVLLLPNGCDFPLFSSTAASPRRSSDLVIGYTGTIAEWFDWRTVIGIAEAFPQASVRLVGPVVAAIPGNLPANIQFDGLQPYDKLPEFNALFDVCIIPFLQGSSLIAATSPIKLYEYLASGKPVVSSPMPDSRELAAAGIVYVAETINSFVRAITEACRMTDDPDLIRRRKTIAHQNSWTERWARMEDSISQLMSNAQP